jgi:hypothetical protein
MRTASLGIRLSSNDFCNTIRNVDTPSELFGPRTCGPAEARTRSPLRHRCRWRGQRAMYAFSNREGLTTQATRGCVPSLARRNVHTDRGHRVRGTTSGCVFEDEPLQSSPSSTLLEHPPVIDACARALERPTAAHQPRLSLQRPLREEGTPSGEPGCLPSSGSFERRGSLLVPANGRPPSHGTLPFGSPCGFASRGSTCAFSTFP